MDIQIIIYGATTILTYLLGLASKKFHWNEKLPIPVQNILIGIITLLICWFMSWLSNESAFDVNETIKLIAMTMGGVGTATVVYDTKKKVKEEK